MGWAENRVGGWLPAEKRCNSGRLWHRCFVFPDVGACWSPLAFGGYTRFRNCPDLSACPLPVARRTTLFLLFTVTQRAAPLAGAAGRELPRRGGAAALV